MPRRSPVALALLALTLLTAACSAGSTSAGPAASATTSVSVASVEGLTASATTSCRSLKAALPAALDTGINLRPTTPASDTTAAWGDPAITLRCGVPAGSERDDPYLFEDVRWAMHDDGAFRRWTTMDRKVNVAVVFPDRYEGQAELLVTLAPAVKKGLGPPLPATVG